jgi:hypothetical protein
MKGSKPVPKKKEAKPANTKASAKSAKSASGPNTTNAAKSNAAKQTSADATAAPQAAVVDQELQLPATHGKISIFGGPKDRGIKPEDKLALPTGPHGVYERVRSLNPKSFYCSMRWNYHVQHLTPEEVKRSWANEKLLVTNAKNGNAVIVRAVDYGPHENTGLDIGISPGASEALGVEVGDEVSIALADSKSPLGPTKA